MSRYASLWNKRDGNEAEILDALADMLVPYVEAGPLDGWLVLCGRWVCVEFKSAKGTLTPGQKTFTDLCQRHGWPYLILRSVDDAIAEVNKWRSRI